MMSRRFLADDGIAWQVWSVHPSMLERRDGRDRRAALREGGDRRQIAESRFILPNGMRDGWLVFQSTGELRRLAPARDDFDVLSDRELSTLVAMATSYGRPRRRMEWTTHTPAQWARRSTPAPGNYPNASSTTGPEG